MTKAGITDSDLMQEVATIADKNSGATNNASGNGHAALPVELVWVDAPPPENRPAARWVVVAAQLRTKPGAWAALGVQRRSACGALRQQGSQVVRRSTERPGLVDVYARVPVASA